MSDRSMLVKKLSKYETLVLESSKGQIEIVIAYRQGSTHVLNVYAPKSIKISSNMDRKDQYNQLNADMELKAQAKINETVKYFAAGKGRVDE
jgi:hypothetical protein